MRRGGGLKEGGLKRRVGLKGGWVEGGWRGGVEKVG